MAIDLVAPLVGYVTPGLGRSQTTDRDVEGGHFAERFQSFVIIALGESIVITGATAGSRGLTASSVVALAVAFFVSGALFWLYFGEVAEHSMSDIAEAEDPGSLARVVALAVLGLLGGEMSALVLTGCVAALLAVLAMSEAGWLGRLRTREVVADRTT